MPSDFNFLDEIAPEIADLGRLASGYVEKDPSKCLAKLREFGECVILRHAAAVGEKSSGNKDSVEILSRLTCERSIPDEIVEILHYIRRCEPLEIAGGGGGSFRHVPASRWLFNLANGKPGFYQIV